MAGQVDFGPRVSTSSTLVWMAVAYYASLKPERTCYARVDTLAKKAKGVSTRTVKRKLNELAGLGYIYDRPSVRGLPKHVLGRRAVSRVQP